MADFYIPLFKEKDPVPVGKVNITRYPGTVTFKVELFVDVETDMRGVWFSLDPLHLMR